MREGCDTLHTLVRQLLVVLSLDVFAQRGRPVIRLATVFFRTLIDILGTSVSDLVSVKVVRSLECLGTRGAAMNYNRENIPVTCPT